MDYCHLVGPNFSEDQRVMEVIGFRSRIPRSHKDWYQPPSCDIIMLTKVSSVSQPIVAKDRTIDGFLQ